MVEPNAAAMPSTLDRISGRYDGRALRRRTNTLSGRVVRNQWDAPPSRPGKGWNDGLAEEKRASGRRTATRWLVLQRTRDMRRALGPAASGARAGGAHRLTIPTHKNIPK